MGSAVSTDVRLHHNLFNWPYLPPDQWIAGGQIKAGANTFQWFAEAVVGRSVTTMDELLGEAEGSDVGSGGVIFLPYTKGPAS